jgi:hypothetical protein
MTGAPHVGGESLQIEVEVSDTYPLVSIATMEMVIKKKRGLLPCLQSFGRLQIVMTGRKFGGKWKEKGETMMLIGYAADHMGDTCKIFNPIAKMRRLSRVIKWLEWKTLDPYQEMNIFHRQPDIYNEKKHRELDF